MASGLEPFSNLDQAIKDRLQRDACCDSGDAIEGHTKTVATVRQRPLLARLRCDVDLAKGGGLCDQIMEPLDATAILSEAATQADADAGIGYLISDMGAADYDDAARRALKLVAKAYWRIA